MEFHHKEGLCCHLVDETSIASVRLKSGKKLFKDGLKDNVLSTQVYTDKILFKKKRTLKRQKYLVK